MSKHRTAAFKELQSPIFQSGGDCIVILIEDRDDHQERKMITIKKGKDGWIFKNLPVNVSHRGSYVNGVSSHHTTVEWMSNDGAMVRKEWSSQTRPTQCEELVEVFEGIMTGQNKYQLAQ